MILPQDKALEVVSCARLYTTSGPFCVPFIRATFLNMDDLQWSELDINGGVPLLPKIPVTLDCGTSGVNTSDMQINLVANNTGIVVYWTQYSGFEWNKR